ncbi:diguanylate cyclase (GGDEF) domain-containing protein [Kaistia soli DSM 19436]|uniref:diguanylate cyclase n=1 Tax=Kaistia soli DSM 19436 TaxID=1122133 RepID=A0A1M5L311_9HYPH|nr:sensor domain-containing diguanylate cyclase [Kaistia soli]SHG59407.1 diguanylate cyclase (GGDEF) domain-containing protein [Kaistia soli DSM 19436]
MWIPPEAPSNEIERLEALAQYGILDTARDERYDRIARIAAKAYAADIAFLSFVDAQQQWMKAKTSDVLHDFVARDASVCTLVISSGESLVFEDMRTAPELEGHPLARDMPWRFYASVPIRGEGSNVLGTLCIMRTDPGTPADFELETLLDLAAITSHELSLTLHNTQLREQSNTDSLTGIHNRRKLDEEMPRAIRRSTRTSTPATLLLIDLDHFKEVNDRLGHQAGDDLLARFAAFLQSFPRRPDDVLARFGGEEFALILAGTDEDGGVAVATRIIASLAKTQMPHPARGQLSASIGIAALGAADDKNSWLARADRALYLAKGLGRAALSVA